MRQDTDTAPPDIKRLRAQRDRQREPALTAGTGNAFSTLRPVTVEAQAQFKREDAEPKPTRTRQRKPTLAGVARQAAKAGIEVARYELPP